MQCLATPTAGAGCSGIERHVAALISAFVDSFAHLLFLAVIAALLIAFGGPVRAATLESIALRYRTADEVIPYLQPLLKGEDAVITGRGGQLLVKATPAQFEQIRALVGTLDVSERRLLVTVGQLVGVDEYGLDYLNRRTTASPHASMTKATTRIDDQVIQRLQILDGHEAFIDVSQLVPEIDGIAVSNGIIFQELVELRYRSLADGFFVRPRVTGDQVTVEVSAYRQRELDDGGGRADTQRLLTTISGPLGQWLMVGGSALETATRQSTVTRSTRDLTRPSRVVMIKFEELR